MLDEPFAGIDPVTVQNIQEVIRELAQNNIAILITDHAAREILQITDRTYVVSEGRILEHGTPDEIAQNETVRRKYLGEIDFASEQANLNATERIKEHPESQVQFNPNTRPKIVSTLKNTDLE